MEDNSMSEHESIKRSVVLIRISCMMLVIVIIAWIYFRGSLSDPERISVSPTPAPTAEKWVTYYHPDGLYSFKYPERFIRYDDNPLEVQVSFPEKDYAFNHASFTVRKTYNEYNRPLNKLVETGSDEQTKIESTVVAGLPALVMYDQPGTNAESYFVDNQGEIFSVTFSNFGDKENNKKIFIDVLASITFATPPEKTEDIWLFDGDIYVRKEGKETKIVGGGFNAGILASPDRSKVAYVAKSKETFENEKTDREMYGYLRYSTNAWVVNSDGTKPVQVTQHENYVTRTIIHWLDNERFIYQDGIASVRVFNTSTGELQTVLGPDYAMSPCQDVCSDPVDIFVSPDNEYIVSIESPDESYSKVSILNVRTLKTTELPQQNFSIAFDSVTFAPDNTVVFFNAYRAGDNPERLSGSLDLTTNEIDVY